MRVLSAVALAVIGICLVQANAVPVAEYNKDASTALKTQSHLYSDVLTRILEAIKEAYFAIRNTVLKEINQILKFMKIDFDFEAWFNDFEASLLECGRNRRQDMAEEGKKLLNDTLGCVQVNVDKIDEIRERGLLALELFIEAGPKFREYYEECEKVENPTEKPVTEKPTEPTKPVTEKPTEPTKPVTEKPTEPEKPVTEKPTEPEKPVNPGTSTSVAQGKGTKGFKCLATAAGKTAVFLKPVPGHLYTFIKMIFNVSFNDKQEAFKCIKEKSGPHWENFKTIMQDYAICIALA